MLLQRSTQTSLQLLSLFLPILDHSPIRTVLLHRLIRMLNRQTPNIQVITNAKYHINHKAPINSNSQSQAAKHKRNLVDVVPQRARPPNDFEIFEEPGPNAVGDAEDQRED